VAKAKQWIPVTEPLSAERVHLVIAKLDEAITKLAFHPYVSLKAREAEAFTGQFGGLKASQTCTLFGSSRISR
jgi:hypothetical protein